jgi:hypothetical protein
MKQKSEFTPLNHSTVEQLDSTSDISKKAELNELLDEHNLQHAWLSST